MIWLYRSSLLAGVLTAGAILSVRADYASRETLSGFSVLIVWVAYLWHADVVIWAAIRQVWPLHIPLGLALSLGGLLALGGVAILVTAIWTFRSVQRMSGRQTDKLIDSGIYAWSRNPQNLGWWLALFGIAVLGRSGFALLLSVLFAFSIHAYIVLLEEPYLEDVYGEVYLGYRSKTKRYLGFPK